jgi:hypothetical protein
MKLIVGRSVTSEDSHQTFPPIVPDPSTTLMNLARPDPQPSPDLTGLAGHQYSVVQSPRFGPSPIPGLSNTSTTTTAITLLDERLNNSEELANDVLSSILRCDHPDCETKTTTFGRKSDLKRHKQKHQGSAFLCTAVGCTRKSTKGFDRKDKLLEHVRRAHGHDASFTCPLGCEIEPLPLLLLGIHMNSFHWLDFVARAWRPLFYNPFCPLKPCRKPFYDTTELHEHISQKHSVRDRESQSSSMLAAGFDPFSCGIICPLCEQTFSDAKSSTPHILLSHMVDRDHFMAWINAINTDRKKRSRLEYSLIECASDYWRRKTIQDFSSVTCPQCLYSSSYMTFVSSNHHKAMEAVSPALRTHREAILRLIPECGGHSVFDDLRPSNI